MLVPHQKRHQTKKRQRWNITFRLADEPMQAMVTLRANQCLLNTIVEDITEVFAAALEEED